MNNKRFLDYRSAQFSKEMREYIKELKTIDRLDQKEIENTRQELIHFGIADKSGHIKKKIVSWE